MYALNFHSWMLVLTSITVLFATVYNYKWRRIPDTITIPSIFLGFIMHGLHPVGGGLSFSIWGVIVGIGISIILYFLGGIGGGDVKLMGGVGALLGANNFITVLVLAIYLGSLVAICKMVAINYSFKNTLSAFRYFLINISHNNKLEVDQKNINPLTEQYVAYAILSYLLKHPSAKDTLPGISKWWLLKEQIDHTADSVSTALDSLVSAGFLNAKEYQEQEKYYELNHKKLEKVKRTLKEMEERIKRQGSFN